MKSIERGFSEDFLIIHLLTAVSHLISRSSISALVDYKQALVFYGGLAAYPSTGKTPAMDLIKKSFIAVEKFLEIDSVESPLING